MRSSSRPTLLLGGIAAVSLALAGCASSPAADSAGDDDLVQIVASTNVYGDIAERVGGDLVNVTSIITSAAQDPHSYEATAQDQLVLSKAALVIENGGGYDPFIDTMLDASGSEDVVIVNASEASGLLEGGEEGHTEDEEGHAEGEEKHAEGEEAHAEGEEGHAHIEGFNEHVWYSFHGVEKLAEKLSAELSEIDSANASTYEENYTAFAAEIEALEERATGMQASATGKGVAITEPVPLYILDEVGLENKTPEAFSEAIEEGTDVAPATLQETLSLFDDGSVSLLAYNEQTEGPETEQVREAAESAGIPVVSFTETLPEGEDYLGWMTANLDAIEDALA